MFKLYSKRSEYTIRILAGLTPGDLKGAISLVAAAQAAGVKESYARKGFQLLSSAGLLKAANGPGGGYQLNRSVKEISLLDIILAIDGDDYYDHCVLGLPVCGDDGCCAVHHHWGPLKVQLLKTLKKITLNDLIKRNKGGDS